MNSPIESLIRYQEYLPRTTAAGGYLYHLAEEIERNCSAKEYAERWRPMAQSQSEHWGKCFLTVLMRTQGRRPEALREALLCLYAQDDKDFEVLLIGHKLNEEQKTLVFSILDEQDPEFRSRIRYLPLDEGNRTTPLNFGFAQAHGEYISIFDDDDLVMEDWVARFHAAAKETPGAVIYRYVISQKWRGVETQWNEKALRAEDKPNTMYCKDYWLLDQLRMNNCPTLGLAFPAAGFRHLGLIFDETLTTTEDWDYQLRIVKYFGAVSVPQIGAIYRLWTNEESSATEHKKEEWDANYRRIQDKLKEMPILLPAQAAMRAGGMTEENKMAQEIINSRIWKATEPYRRFMIWLKPILWPKLRAVKRTLKRWKARICRQN